MEFSFQVKPVLSLACEGLILEDVNLRTQSSQLNRLYWNLTPAECSVSFLNISQLPQFTLPYPKLIETLLALISEDHICLKVKI